MIDEARIHERKPDSSNHRGGRFVLYWMQAAQRVSYNYALGYAIEQANQRGLPLVVAFSLDFAYPSATLRHYRFMLEGLKETAQALADIGASFKLLQGSPTTTIPALAKEADRLVMDKGYTRIQRQWREAIEKKVACRIVEVETETLVPVALASDKEAYAAYTLRKKIHAHLLRFLVPYRLPQLQNKEKLPKNALNAFPNNIDRFLKKHLSESQKALSASVRFKSGRSHAIRRLERFIEKRLRDYPAQSRNAGSDGLSTLSPYLHFGQISPVEVALAIVNAAGKGAEEFLEQLIVRRELAMNFTHFNEHYDQFSSLPEWAIKTLTEHTGDKREHLYSFDEFNMAKTHDAFWNAAQKELSQTGVIHSYMRMYWGKKILEWTPSPKEAFRIANQLNDTLALDGRDPNGYAGVAWCFGKHDRAFKERPIFGKIRYMNAMGLKRKFDPAAYIARVERYEKQANTDKGAKGSKR